MAPLIPPLLHAHASVQFGLVTRAQAMEELTSSALNRRLASGLLVRVDRGVYRLTGAAPSWRQRALAACLAIGSPAAVSHLAAAYLWRVASVALPRIQLTVPPGRRSTRIFPPPRRVPLPALDVTSRWVIPTTTPARTIIDLSTQVAKPLLERVADDLIRQGHLRIGEIPQRLEAADPLPRHRSDVIAEIVAVRLARGVGASRGEDWIVDTVLAAGFAVPARNVIVEAGGRLYELDVAYPELKIGIEYDGWQVHGDHQHFHSDRQKLAALQLEGWLILSVTSAWSEQMLVARLTSAIQHRQQSGLSVNHW